MQYAGQRFDYTDAVVAPLESKLPSLLILAQLGARIMVLQTMLPVLVFPFLARVTDALQVGM